MPSDDVVHFLADIDPNVVADIALKLIRAASPNPPGPTKAAAAAAAALIAEHVPMAEVRTYEAIAGTVNVVATVQGRGPGKRLMFNGHLDTYPAGPLETWTVDPSGELRDDRLYGRGAVDMKGGIAAMIVALSVLGRARAQWAGEVVLSLAGDEESMGDAGTQWLLKNLAWPSIDGVLIADAGSPHVLRFGEKGFLWVEIEAQGRPAHGAHVHLGDNALDRLRRALDRVCSLEELKPNAPACVTQAIAASKAISEPLAGAGEADVLGRLTVNIGAIAGGTLPNLVPASARAELDIRIPVGLTLEKVEEALARALDAPGLTYRVLRRFAANYTDPYHPLVQISAAAARAVTGRDVAVNLRVGGSDARWFRMRGLPTVVYGPTPYAMGSPDEYALVDELVQIAKVYAQTAFDLLGPSP